MVGRIATRKRPSPRYISSTAQIIWTWWTVKQSLCWSRFHNSIQRCFKGAPKIYDKLVVILHRLSFLIMSACHIHSRLVRTLFLRSEKKPMLHTTPITLWSTGNFHQICPWASWCVFSVFDCFCLLMITKIFKMTRQKKSWFFEPSMSSGSLDDEIYTINMIAYTLAEFSRYPGDQLLHLLIWNCSGHFHRDDYPFMRQMIDMALKLVEDSFDEELFVKVMCGQHFSAIVTTIFIAKNTITM